MPSIARLDDRDLLRRVYGTAVGPAILTLVASASGIVFPCTAGHVVADVAAGLPLNAVWKLVTCTTLLLMGVAFVTSSMPAGRAFRWAACALAGVSFDALAGGMGIFVGVLPAVSRDLGGRGTCVGLYLVAFAITGMSVMRLPARMLYGFTTPEILKRRRLRLALGFIFVVSAAAAAMAELRVFSHAHPA